MRRIDFLLSLGALLTSTLLAQTRVERLASVAPAPSAPVAPSDRIAAIERRLDIARLMTANHVPGLSVAVIDGCRIAWAKGYGVTEAGGSNPVTADTLFLAGSISKSVSALGALALVESGKLSLDEDVNRRLRSWRVPAGPYSAQPVTLARLLDHTAGFTGGEFYPGYEIGAPLPSLVQILDGQPPATNPAVRVSFMPGSKWQYSGDGYLVVQQLMIDVSGRSFAELMRELVFARLDMRRTTFEQPLPNDLSASAAAGTRIDGSQVRGKWHVTPELAAAGLWSTPTDLAKVAIEVALSAQGKANRVLSRNRTVDMLAPHVSDGVINILGTAEDPDAMGYGFFVGAKTHRFGHVGGHVGYQATFVMFADSGNGAVIMTNSDHGLLVGNQMLNAIATEYRWNYTVPSAPS
jgi:CubicO group peptidase (beta-lactamase class C family)